MSTTPTRGLGKGLSVLISEEYSKSFSSAEAEASGSGNGPQLLGIDRIVTGKFQPRQHFSETYLQELSESIKRNGIMQPLVVRPVKNSQYEIIAGERRWRAAKLAGLLEVPVIVRDVEDRQALELALIENIQRQDLTPLEEAAGYQRLIDEFAHTQEELSGIVGKSRSHIANLLRMLSMPDNLKQLLNDGSLSMGHARALMGAKDPQALAEEVVRRGLNVRQTENLCRGEGQGIVDAAPKERPASRGSSSRATPAPGQKDDDIAALEETLTNQLGMPVAINARGQEGDIVIRYDSLTQLNNIITRLGDNF